MKKCDQLRSHPRQPAFSAPGMGNWKRRVRRMTRDAKLRSNGILGKKDKYQKRFEKLNRALLHRFRAFRAIRLMLAAQCLQQTTLGAASPISPNRDIAEAAMTTEKWTQEI